ncbi:hypothetical protein H0H87_011804 [Tephrocybe sp. NHM501043]|nr:hypothetical protein H0H87_011804 [Tephrocybe sp. NHM501043]
MQSSSRSFSIEWEEDFSADYSAWLEVGTECLRIKVGSPTTSLTKTTFIVNFTSIRKLAMGYEGNPYLCLDLDHPSIIEESDMYPASTGLRLRRRIGHTSEGIARVAQYAHHIRVVLHKDSNTDVIDGLAHQLKTTGLDEKKILRFKGYIAIDAHKGDLYADRHIHKLRRIYEELPWSIVFQVESLLKNGVLHTMELLHLMQDIQTRPQCIPETAVVVLRALYRALHTGGLREPPTSYFQRLYTDFKQLDTTLSPNTFPCQYITFTPTRAFLRGPFPTRSNRVLRKYAAHEDRFIRVSFRDEDLLPYRESRDVDLWGLIEAKVGGILKNGFKVGNRHYQFLGYSISGLRNHSVWFMSPFIHPVLGLVTPDVVRSSLGDFTNVRQSPSMYGARLAQAFTSTVPTVLLGSTEWEVVDDLGSEPYQFTDGAGTMSESLGRQVWLMLLSKGLYDGIEPSAYQIRFKGFKGMLVVDAHFDETEGIRMRLRPSMRKFHTGDEPAELEIVEAFDRPHGSYLNRSLVLVLENLGVPTHAFISLQEQAAADVRDSDELSDSFHRLMEDRRLGHHFRLSSTIKQVVQLVRQSSPDLAEQFLRSPFLRHVAQVVKSAVLQDMKYGARVPIPKSYVLAGVPDEGPAYEMAGRSDVYSLQPGQVYACVHHPGDAEPTWLSGPCLISRSPIVHPGDVQKVHAIGKPSEGMFCAFAHLKNVVVLPSIGQRSLASCLGGGDVDGDTFSLIFHEPLFPPKFVDPGDYLDCKPHNIGRESTGEDVGDFVVKFITTDVLVGPKNKTWTILAEMCAKAADYPKRGNPVVVDHEELARTVSLRKPDWRSTAREAGGPKAYYTSTSAVGHMFRSISTGEDSDTPDERPSVRRLDFSILPILGATVEQHPVPSSDSIAGLEALFSGPSPFPASTSADRALLLATVSSLDPPHFLAPVITTAATTTRAHLTIVLFSRHFNNPTGTATLRGVSRTGRFEDVCRFLTYVYVQATSVAQALDKILMEIDVLLLGIDDDVPCTLGQDADVVFRVAGDSIGVQLPEHVSALRQSYLTAADHDSIEHPVASTSSSPSSLSQLSAERTPPRLPVVAIGGTFDHLHAGHKILLSMAAWITSEKIIVGVTDDALLGKKSHPQQLQPLAERIARVRAFLALFRPGIEYYIVPIQDVYGPTGWDPNVQGLVVSHETLSGAEAIATHRSKQGFSRLQTFVIDVISAHSPWVDPEDVELMRRTKMGSTFIRQWIADSQEKEKEGGKG